MILQGSTGNRFLNPVAPLSTRTQPGRWAGTPSFQFPTVPGQNSPLETFVSALPEAAKAIFGRPIPGGMPAGDAFSFGLQQIEKRVGSLLSRASPALMLLPQVGSGNDPVRVQQSYDRAIQRGLTPGTPAFNSYRGSIMRGEVTGREDVRGGRRPVSKPINPRTVLAPIIKKYMPRPGQGSGGSRAI